MPTEEEKIARMTLAGIAQAQRDYRSWSGDCNLRDAPEYMITTSVARKLAGMRERTFDLTLEHNIRDTNRKFDIALWNGDDPIAAIEIKKLRRRIERIEHDLDRIIETLLEEPEFGFGLVAYYIFNDSKLVLRNTINEIEEQARPWVEDNGFNFDPYRRHVGASDDFYWSAGVLKIARG